MMTALLQAFCWLLVSSGAWPCRWRAWLVMSRRRRFDTDVGKMSELMREERAVRERLQRERDELAADKYKTEQELKVSVTLRRAAATAARLVTAPHPCYVRHWSLLYPDRVRCVRCQYSVYFSVGRLFSCVQLQLQIFQIVYNAGDQFVNDQVLYESI